jgi:hypothetical protein
MRFRAFPFRRVGTKSGTAPKTGIWKCEENRSNLLEELRKYGAPGEIRTPDLMLRRHSLYPAELRARSTSLAYFRVPLRIWGAPRSSNLPILSRGAEPAASCATPP